MVDALGRSLTDARRAEEGFLPPIGGYKGYGLALVFGLLAGLNGAAFGRDVIDFNKDDKTPTNTGQRSASVAYSEDSKFFNSDPSVEPLITLSHRRYLPPSGKGRCPDS
jgi:LDH2 family malate/lactate/ureidoglycolate dehydrogenase